MDANDGIIVNSLWVLFCIRKDENGRVRMCLMVGTKCHSGLTLVSLLTLEAMMTVITNGALLNGVPRLTRQPRHTCGCSRLASDGGFVKIMTRSGFADVYLRKEALDLLLPYQRSDFHGIFRAMDGIVILITFSMKGALAR
nr:pyruvate, phosphate dikinase, chloroplastic [Tanacetum cinerariifolium]